MSTKKSLVIPDIYNLIVYWYNIPSLLKKDFLELGTGNMEKKYCVYKHTSPNGKVYIGITCQNPLKRWQNGFGYIGNEHFHRAILKYGWDNFSHEIIKDELQKEEAEQIEIELIAKYKSTDEKFGYNISSGGENHFKGYYHSEETKKKIGDAQRGTLNHMFGKTPWNKGKRFNSEARKKMSENRLDKKKVLQFDLNGNFVREFESLSEVARVMNVAKQSIRASCKKANRTSCGYVWKYADDN